MKNGIKKITALISALSLSLCSCTSDKTLQDPEIQVSANDTDISQEAPDINTTPEATLSDNIITDPITRPLADDEILKYNSAFVKACCDDDCVIALTYDGKVITWGSNYSGKIGNGEMQSRTYDPETGTYDTPITPVRPHIIEFPERVIDIGCDTSMAYAITESGEVYMWGYNVFGQCGISAGAILTPQKLEIPDKIKKLSLTDTTVLLLSEYGDVYLSGIDYMSYSSISEFNENVHLEYDPKSPDTPVPTDTAQPGYTKLELPFTVSDIVCGDAYYCFLSDSGEVFFGGELLNVEYSLPSNTSAMSDVSDAVLKKKLGFPARIIAIDGSANFISALSDSGNLYLYGVKENVFFNEGNDTELYTFIFRKDTLPQIISIDQSEHGIIAMDIDNNLWGFGRDSCGELDISGLDNDFASYKIYTYPVQLDYKNVKDYYLGIGNSIFVTDDGRIHIQGSMTVDN